jgi:hypothetical protein
MILHSYQCYVLVLTNKHNESRKYDKQYLWFLFSIRKVQSLDQEPIIWTGEHVLQYAFPCYPLGLRHSGMWLRINGTTSARLFETACSPTNWTFRQLEMRQLSYLQTKGTSQPPNRCHITRSKEASWLSYQLRYNTTANAELLNKTL